MILHFPTTPIRATRHEQIAEAFRAGAEDNELLQRFGVTWRAAVVINAQVQEARQAKWERESRMRRAA